MNVLILNRKFESILLVEAYQSLIWNDKYDESGDFELYIPATAYDRSFYAIGNYVSASLSDRLMIIEKVDCKTDSEIGDFITITGRSLESILTRRILIGGVTDYIGNLQEMFEKMFNDNVINPSDQNRQIPNVVFKRSTDKRITELTIEAQYDGDILYDVIVEHIKNNDIGMKMTKNDLNEFVFELYKGVDRSYQQSTNPWIVFSPEFDNLLNSEYYESETNYKNYAYVSGDFEYETEEETQKDDGSIITSTVTRNKIVMVEVGKEHAGLDRYECYTNASDIRSRTLDDETNEYVYISEESYKELLQQEGVSTLGGYKKYTKFDCEIDYSHTFKMNQDYFLGDIVQVSNQYGYSGSFRVSEFVISVSETGVECYPVFVNTDKEDDQNEL